MSWSERAEQQELGARRGARRRRRSRSSSRIAAHSATASSKCRSTVKRWYALRCGRARTCSHSGSSRTSTPDVVERLEHRDRAAARPQQPRRTRRGASASTRPSRRARAMRASVPGRSAASALGRGRGHLRARVDVSTRRVGGERRPARRGARRRRASARSRRATRPLGPRASSTQPRHTSAADPHDRARRRRRARATSASASVGAEQSARPRPGPGA